MKILSLILLLAFSVALTNARNYDINAPIHELYKIWLSDHPFHYKNGFGYADSFNIFESNVHRIRSLNALHGGSATFNLNEFALLTEEEFHHRYLSSEIPYRNKNQLNSANRVGRSKLRELPTAFDWRKADPPVVTRVKDQGSCGSCWAFSTTGNIEGVLAHAGHELIELSEQQLVDCDHKCIDFVCDSGCQGGLMQNALEYTIEIGGLESEETYPYTGYDGKCQFKKKLIAASIENYTFIPSEPDQMMYWLVNNGPVAVAADASTWQFYSSGILSSCGRNLNHGILLVGYDVDSTTGKDLPYWIIKNSWGPTWGMDGYILVARGKNQCGLEEYPITAVVESTN